MSYKKYMYNYFLILQSGQYHIPVSFLVILKHLRWNQVPQLQFLFSHRTVLYISVIRSITHTIHFLTNSVVSATIITTWDFIGIR